MVIIKCYPKRLILYILANLPLWKTTKFSIILQWRAMASTTRLGKDCWEWYKRNKYIFRSVRGIKLSAFHMKCGCTICPSTTSTSTPILSTSLHHKDHFSLHWHKGFWDQRTFLRAGVDWYICTVLYLHSGAGEWRTSEKLQKCSKRMPTVWTAVYSHYALNDLLGDL